MKRDDNERGGIALLLMGFVAILTSLLLVGIDTTTLYLARIETLNSADAAARDAADSLSDDDYYGSSENVLDPAAADLAARRSLARQVPSTRVAAWQVSSVQVSETGAATVQVTTEVDFPVTDLVRGYLPGGTTVTVESTARAASTTP